MKEEIIELRQKGYSYNEIKEKLKCSKSTISYHCSNMIGNNEKIEKNLDIKNKKQKKDVSFLIDNLDIDEVINLRKEKKHIKKLKRQQVIHYTQYQKYVESMD